MTGKRCTCEGHAQAAQARPLLSPCTDSGPSDSLLMLPSSARWANNGGRSEKWG